MLRRVIFGLAVAGLAVALPPACSSSDGGSPKKSAPAPATSTSTTHHQSDSGGASAGTTGTADPCAAAGGTSGSGSGGAAGGAAGGASTDTSGGTGTDTGTGTGTGTQLDLLGGAAAPAYADVSGIIAASCALAGCHDGPTDNAANQPDMTAQAGVESDPTNALKDLNGGKMPKTGTLQDADKAKLIAYFTAVAAAAAPATDTSGGSGTGAAAPCGGISTDTGGASAGGTTAATTAGGTTGSSSGGMTTPGAPDSVFNASVVNDSGVTQCHAQGLMYNYLGAKCDTAKYPAAFSCDKAGIDGAFGAGAIDPIITPWLAGNYILQCGIEGTTKVIFALCLSPDQGKTCLSEADAKNANTKVSVNMSCVGKLKGSGCSQPAK